MECGTKTRRGQLEKKTTKQASNQTNERTNERMNERFKEMRVNKFDTQPTKRARERKRFKVED